MARGLLTLPLALFVAAAFPLHAFADGTSAAILEAKGFDIAGSDTGGLTDENGLPTIGDAAAGGARAFRGHTSAGIQVNDPTLDNIQFFPNALPQPQRPFELSIQSETSMATFGATRVVGFNNSADQPLVLTPQNTLAFVHRFLSGVGVSHNDGQTWAIRLVRTTGGRCGYDSWELRRQAKG
jgi:hypothetical protein